MSKQALAVVTMVYNEPDFLPVWFRYYSAQIGAENCFIIDHGSDDGSTAPYNPDCSIIRLARSAHSDVERARLVSRFVASLLVSYNRVLYVDVDELIVADPRYYSGLLDYCSKSNLDVVTMLGMDIVQDYTEQPIDVAVPILSQRRWARPLGFLCKPSITNKEIAWWSGFHGYNGPSLFDNIYLFHLAMVDEGLVRRRQEKRNVSAPIDGGGAHHLMTPDAAVDHMRNIMLAGNRIQQAEFEIGAALRDAFVERLFAHDERTDQIKNFTLNGGLWEIPERLKTVV